MAKGLNLSLGLVVSSQPPLLPISLLKWLSSSIQIGGGSSRGNRKLIISHHLFQKRQRCDIFSFFFFCAAFVVRLPVLGCGRRIRYHCLGCSPAPLVYHAAFPPLRGGWGDDGPEGCTARDDRCSSSKKSTNQVLISPGASETWNFAACSSQEDSWGLTRQRVLLKLLSNHQTNHFILLRH